MFDGFAEARCADLHHIFYVGLEPTAGATSSFHPASADDLDDVLGGLASHQT